MSPVLFGCLCFALETSVAVTAGASAGGGGVAQGVQTAWRGELQLEAFTADTDRE